MKISYRRLFALILCMIIPFAISASAFAASDPPVLNATATKDDIQPYGNIILSLLCNDILNAGYQYGDVVTVSFLDTSLDLPLCSDYSDVDARDPGLFARPQDTNVKLAINLGDFATAYHIGVCSHGQDDAVTWDYAPNVEGPVQFTISMKEAGGYYGMYMAHQLVYSDERSDYPNLTDLQFANFRAVTTTGMGQNILFRSASPIDPEYNRNVYADNAIRDAGVTFIMNLADDEKTIQSYEGYSDTYYSTVSHIALNTQFNFTEPDFQQRLAKGLRFFAENPGIYLVHCTEGKDRAGLAAALLECLMGATAEEVIADYMVTYYNYYDVTPEEDRYEVIANGNIVKTLCSLFGIDSLDGADLAACAEQFFGKIGLTEGEIRSLKANLAP